MPEIGEIRGAKELGYKGTGRRIWAGCEICGKERWVYLHSGRPLHSHCYSCSVEARRGKYTYEKNYRWRGGKTSIWKTG